MADTSMHLVYDTFKQSPGYFDDAYNSIKDALYDLSNYNTAISYSGLRSRTTMFDVKYSAVYANVNMASTSAVKISGFCNTVIYEYEAYQNGTFNTGAADTSGGTITAPEIQANTQAEVGETDDNNTVWENVWGFICKVGDAIVEFIEGLVATFLDLVVSLLEGLCKLVEAIVDAAVLLVGTLVGWTCSAINWLFGTNIDVAAIENWVQSFVATDWVGSAFDWFYTQTGFGQWLASNSIIHDTFIREIIVGAGEWIGIIGAGIAIAYFTGGTALPAYVAAVAGVYGFGSGAESAYANGATYLGGLGIGLLKGTVDAIMGYFVGGTTQAVLSNWTTLVAKNGTTYILQRTGTGLGTRWTLSSIAANTSTALVPTTTTTALSTFLATSLGPVIAGGGLVPTILGTFGLGTVLTATVLGPGLVEALLPHGGTPAGGLSGGGAPTAICPNCGNPVNQCTCPPTDEDKLCDKCGKFPCECPPDGEDDDVCSKCGKNPCECPPESEDNVCPNCGKNPCECPPDSGGEGVCPNCGNNPCICNPGGGGGGIPTTEERCPNCGNLLSQCTCSSDPGFEEPKEDTCPNCGNPLSQCTCKEEDQTEEEEKCPNCGKPLSECTCSSEEDPENPEEPENPEDPEVPTEPEEPKEDKEPNISFINVGPSTVDVTPSSNGNINYGPSGGDINYGGGNGIIGETPSGNVQFQDPSSSGTIDVGKEEPVYEFETMTPTLENPDLENISLQPTSSNPTIENITTPLGNSMENISVTSLSDLTSQAGTGLDASMLGMGGVAFGATAASMYGASKRNNSTDDSDKKREEYRRKVEEDRKKFEEI